MPIDDPDLTRTSAGAPEPPQSKPAALPASIGPYRILSVLGEGGMGIVYEAEQTSPRRSVALKVVRGGQFVDDLKVRMFQREVQALALLKHPNIAAVYESGHTDDGQHFFAMELVRGRTLRDYLGDAPLSGRSGLVMRLDLFRTICDAVQYAHQRGVIHRDLKPGNIVVADEDGRPVVKILDFGLARITESDVAATKVTEIGVIKGTLAYMSPEQARGNPDEIDARTDVYALGVILYEMLSGKRPHALDKTSIVDALRIIAVDPPQPLRSQWSASVKLDGDLETIVGKALEREPDRRYVSAAALSDDIGRYLASQPILARPPSTIYQLKKAISRNRAPAALAGALALSIVAFGIWMGVLYARAGRARAEAERQAKIARAVNTFLNEDLLAAVDPAHNTDRDIPMRKVVDLASAKIQKGVPDEPVVEAAIRRTLGQTYLGLGLFEQAEPHLTRALALYADHAGADDPETLRTAALVGSLDFYRGQYDPAIERLKTTGGAQVRILGDGDIDTLTTLSLLASVYYEQGRPEDATATARKVIDGAAKSGRESSDPAMSALSVIATVDMDEGRLDEAEKTLLHSLELQRKKAGTDDALPVMSLMNDLGQVYLAQKRPEDAERITAEALSRARRVLGDDHKETLTFINNLAIAKRRLGRLDEAEALYKEGYEGSRRTVGAEAPTTLISMVNLGSFYVKTGRCAAHEPFLNDTVDLCRKFAPSGTPSLGLALRNRAGCSESLNRPVDAERAYVEADKLLTAVLVADDPMLTMLHESMASFYEKIGRAADAARFTQKDQR